MDENDPTRDILNFMAAKRERQAKKGGALDHIRGDEIPIERVEWIWPGYWSAGSIYLSAGMPDVGKDLLSYHVMARLTSPDFQWPCDDKTTPPVGNVILLQAEDHLSNTVAARMEAAGVDRSRVHIVKMVRLDNSQRMFSFETDLELLRRLIEEIGGVVAVFISPLSAYFGGSKGTDTFRASAVRSVLTPLRDLAETYRLGVWAIAHFNKKEDVRNIVLRISDSLAAAALSRHVYGVITDPFDGDHKYIIRGKNNLAKAGQLALGFRFGVRFVTTKDNEQVEAPCVEFDPEPTDITAADAMSGGNGRPPREREAATAIITAVLREGAKRVKEVLKAGKAEGLSENTMRRAASKLGIIATLDVDTGQGFWRLPATEGTFGTPPLSD